MPEENYPPSMPAWMAEMERRLAAVERAPRLTNASITDDQGMERVVLGLLNEVTNEYGFAVRDGSGQIVYMVSDDGVAYPRDSLLVLKTNDNVVVTAAGFTDTWEIISPYALADAVQIQFAVSVPAGTAAEVRLQCNVGGGIYTDVLAVPDGTAAYYEFKWAVPGLVPGSGPIQFRIQARRTAGAGNVAVYSPVQAFMTTAQSIGAVADGVV